MAEPSTKEKVALSEREIEILRLVATGATNQQIASRLEITLNTVKVHLRNIFAKIGVASRTEASIYAVRTGLVVVDTARGEAPPSPAVVEVPPESPELPETPTVLEIAPTAIELAAPPAVEATTIAADSMGTAGQIAAPDRRWPQAWILGPILGLIVLISGVAWALRTLAPPDVNTPTATVAPATPTSNTWRTRAQMGVPRVRFGLASYNNDKLYVIGGVAVGTVSGVVERYTPANDTWVRLANKPTPVADVQVVMIGGRLYVAGGQLESGAISDQFEVYNPDQDEWQSLPELPAPRSQYAAVVVDGKFYLFGGWDGTAYRAEVWMFDPDRGTWQERTPMPSARGNMGADIVGNQVHVIGGRDATGGLALHQAYDPAQDRAGGQPWRVLLRLPRPIESPTSATVLNSIYTFDPQTSEVLIYDASNASWNTFAMQLPAGTTHMKVVLLNTYLHLLGGSTASDAATFHLQLEVIYRTFLPLGPVP